MDQISIALITGLTTGGLSCLAVQGGLLSSAVAGEEGKYAKTASFLLAKLAAYTLLGFLLGLLGSRLILTVQLQGWLQIAVGLFMLATAARLLNIHPIFRRFVIQPPLQLLRLVRNQSRVKSVFTPGILGALTVFIPCGVTQAMMVLAVGTASPLLGAAIMAAFILGTSPVFFVLGMASTEFLKRKSLVWLATSVIAFLGISAINTGQTLRGSAHTLQNYWQVATAKANTKTSAVAGIDADGKQKVTIQVTSDGYTASAQTLKAGVPVEISLLTNNVQGCTRAFTVPAFNISKVLPKTGVEKVEFTPTQTGRLAFSCAMGMYGGEFTVIQ